MGEIRDICVRLSNLDSKKLIKMCLFRYFPNYFLFDKFFCGFSLKRDIMQFRLCVFG